MTAGAEITKSVDELKGEIDTQKGNIEGLDAAHDDEDVVGFLAKITELVEKNTADGIDEALQKEFLQKMIDFLSHIEDVDDLKAVLAGDLDKLEESIVDGVTLSDAVAVAEAEPEDDADVGFEVDADGLPKFPEDLRGETHTVKRGDTLSGLVKDKFDVNWETHPQLAFAIVKRINDSREGDKDPNVLDPGEVLKWDDVAEGWDGICEEVAGSLDWYGTIGTNEEGWMPGLRTRAEKEVETGGYCEAAPVDTELTALEGFDKGVLVLKDGYEMDGGLTREGVNKAEGWEWINPDAEPGSDGYWDVRKIAEVGELDAMPKDTVLELDDAIEKGVLRQVKNLPILKSQVKDDYELLDGWVWEEETNDLNMRVKKTAEAVKVAPDDAPDDGEVPSEDEAPEEELVPYESMAFTIGGTEVTLDYSVLKPGTREALSALTTADFNLLVSDIIGEHAGKWTESFGRSRRAMPFYSEGAYIMFADFGSDHEVLAVDAIPEGVDAGQFTEVLSALMYEYAQPSETTGVSGSSFDMKVRDTSLSLPYDTLADGTRGTLEGLSSDQKHRLEMFAQSIMVDYTDESVDFARRFAPFYVEGSNLKFAENWARLDVIGMDLDPDDTVLTSGDLNKRGLGELNLMQCAEVLNALMLGYMRQQGGQAEAPEALSEGEAFKVNVAGKEVALAEEELSEFDTLTALSPAQRRRLDLISSRILTEYSDESVESKRKRAPFYREGDGIKFAENWAQFDMIGLDIDPDDTVVDNATLSSQGFSGIDLDEYAKFLNAAYLRWKNKS